MPFRLYVHSCCTITPVATVAPTCDQCGTHGEFYRWELHTPEWNAVYSRWSGLRPNGPHEKRADALLQPLRQSCSRCQGRTVIGDEAGWRRCPLCEGAGGIWTATDEAIRSALDRIRQEFPDAATGSADGWYPLPDLRRKPAKEPSRRSARTPHPSSSRSDPEPTVVLAAAPTTTQVREAFVAAERKLGTRWRLKGRGHCERATLKSWYSRAVGGVIKSWCYVSCGNCTGARRLFPLDLIAEAASTLGVDPEALIGQKC